MYLKLAELFENIATGTCKNGMVSDSAIGAKLEITNTRGTLHFELELDGPCSKKQLQSLVSALLQTTIKFTTNGRNYVASIPIEQTGLTEF